ncbi:helix-turn-helix transcriptional regulator [Treponema sp.]|uniref:helix-turn-helix domain-containing protein n=1 Tax=Treponema sp. TaxID=166 RepID=UPI00298E5DF1|nr:helix-turn-helix transcriptional regulator [Treponema sp.]MCR5614501.1 helix-turn-helix transcriptional regulator [Treponema sp.]
MYKNKNGNRNNISGAKIAIIRKKLSPTMSQRALADKMQLVGIDLDKNAIQRIESGQRFVTDIELKAFSTILGVSSDDLLEPEK